MTTIHNPAEARRLVVGLWTRADASQITGPIGRLTAEAAFNHYAEAAHVALGALGANVPPAPFGLQVIVTEELNKIGPRPPKTSPGQLAAWREALTDAICKRIGF